MGVNTEVTQYDLSAELEFTVCYGRGYGSCAGTIMNFQSEIIFLVRGICRRLPVLFSPLFANLQLAIEQPGDRT